MNDEVEIFGSGANVVVTKKTSGATPNKSNNTKPLFDPNNEFFGWFWRKTTIWPIIAGIVIVVYCLLIAVATSTFPALGYIFVGILCIADGIMFIRNENMVKGERICLIFTTVLAGIQCLILLFSIYVFGRYISVFGSYFYFPELFLNFLNLLINILVFGLLAGSIIDLKMYIDEEK